MKLLRSFINIPPDRTFALSTFLLGFIIHLAGHTSNFEVFAYLHLFCRIFFGWIYYGGNLLTHPWKKEEQSFWRYLVSSLRFAIPLFFFYIGSFVGTFIYFLLNP